MFAVYAVYNQEREKIYIGQTQNLEERLKMHNDHALGGYTSHFSGTWIVIYKEDVLTRQEALVREKQLKSFRGREFIRKHIPR
jgi:putative endonuclease